MNRILSCCFRNDSMMPLMPSPGMPNTTFTPQLMSVWTRTSEALLRMASPLERLQVSSAKAAECEVIESHAQWFLLRPQNHNCCSDCATKFPPPPGGEAREFAVQRIRGWGDFEDQTQTPRAQNKTRSLSAAGPASGN